MMSESTAALTRDGGCHRYAFFATFLKTMLLKLRSTWYFLFFELLKVDIGILHETASICFNVFTARCAQAALE
jgi:hypothetical protein